MSAFIFTTLLTYLYSESPVSAHCVEKRFAANVNFQSAHKPRNNGVDGKPSAGIGGHHVQPDNVLLKPVALCSVGQIGHIKEVLHCLTNGVRREDNQSPG